MTRDGWEVCSKTFLVCAGVYLAEQMISRHLEPRVHDPSFRRATAFTIVQAVAVVLLSLHLLALRAYARVRKSIYDQIRPAIRDRVMMLAFDGESWSSDVPTHGPARRVMEESIADALNTLKASGRDRVARFALEQGFVAEWVKSFSSGPKRDRKRTVSLLGLVSPVAGSTVLPIAVRDKQAAVRVEALRALTLGDQRGVDAIFRSTLRESLLVRALLVSDLKRHASYLLAKTIPALLEQATKAEAARCFEILIAWKRALPSFDIRPWLSDDPDPLLSPLILALLPYVSIDGPLENYLISALNSADLEVQCAAAKAAGSLKLQDLTPALSAALSENRRLALAAGTALAQMGEAGERRLEKIVAGSNQRAALVAMEALERATVRV